VDRVRDLGRGAQGQSDSSGVPAVAAAASLPRRIGFWTAAALVVGHTIGVGIFLTPAQLIGALASPAWTFGVWLAGGALVLAGAFTFGELAARHPEPGGVYVFLRRAWGPRAAFLYGWLSLLVMDPGIVAALALGLSQYLVAVWPAAAGNERWLAAGAVWVLALINMAGLRLSAPALNLVTAAKVLALVGIVAAAWTVGAGSWSHFAPFATRRAGAPPLGEGLGLALVGVFYCFGGFWEASRVAGEIREPDRQLPRALALGVAAITALYFATTAAFLYLVPPAESLGAAAFARRAGEALFGSPGPAVLAAAVTLSAGASAMALLLMAPRLYLAMSDDGLFPQTLARRHPATGAPVRATALLAGLATVFVFSGDFSQIVASSSVRPWRSSRSPRRGYSSSVGGKGRRRRSAVPDTRRRRRCSSDFSLPSFCSPRLPGRSPLWQAS
jgi:APA family basic amino acid/polyamine antiporter